MRTNRRALLELTPPPILPNMLGARRIILFDDSWRSHITVYHPELRGKEAMVQQVLTSPSAIFVSGSAGDSFTFVRSGVTDSAGRQLRVVVKLGIEGTGIVTTAYFTSATGGRQVWP